MLSFDKFDSLLETIDILADTETMKQIKKSAGDINEARFVDLAEAF